MKISTKGRYALRVLIDLAEQQTDNYIPLKEVADRQQISAKYLETIIPTLVAKEVLIGQRGKNGGYRLNKSPAEYTVGYILKLTEGNLSPVACLEDEENKCNYIAECRTLKMWQDLEKLIDDYFESITLADLMDGSKCRSVETIHMLQKLPKCE